MRPLLCLAAIPLLGAAPATTPDLRSAAPMPMVSPYADERCPETPMSLARRQGERLDPRRLGELPMAQAFAAVDRRVAGCAAPMLLTEARP